jgi:hypothetical protein
MISARSDFVFVQGMHTGWSELSRAISLTYPQCPAAHYAHEKQENPTQTQLEEIQFAVDVPPEQIPPRNHWMPLVPLDRVLLNPPCPDCDNYASGEKDERSNHKHRIAMYVLDDLHEV